MKTMEPRKRRIVIILTVAITLLMLSATMVAATHNFSDVPNSPASIHAAVDWGVDRSLVSGCGSGKFCPNSSLTRGQAMLIMKRLAGVVSPAFLTSEFGPTSINLDIKDVPNPGDCPGCPASYPLVCATSIWKQSYEQVAYGYARTTMDRNAVNPLAFVGKVAYQVNGGSWIVMPPTVSSTSQSNTAGEAIQNTHFGTLNLAPNQSYRFAIRLEPRDALSSGDINADGQYSCALLMQIVNRPL